MGLSRILNKIFVLPYLMRDAANEFQNDNFDLAIRIYLKVLDIYPNYYDANLWVATAYSAMEQNNEAIKSFKKAIEINRKGYDAYYNYAQLELKQNRYENSHNLILKAIEFTPYDADNYSNLYYKKGLLEYYLFNYHEALQSFNKSLEYVPTNMEAQNGRTIAADGILSEFTNSN